MGQRIALNVVTTTPQERAQLRLLLRGLDIEGEVIVPSGEITIQIGYKAFPGLLPMAPQIVDVERWIVESRTHHVQIAIGVTGEAIQTLKQRTSKGEIGLNSTCRAAVTEVN